jgi:hypothetical protein
MKSRNRDATTPRQHWARPFEILDAEAKGKLRKRQANSHFTCGGAQKLIGDLQDSEIARFFVVFPGTAESPLAS